MSRMHKPVLDAPRNTTSIILHRDLDVVLPDIDYVEIPVDWWNAEADKSLLIGVFKHGISLYVGWSVNRHFPLCETVPGRGKPDRIWEFFFFF